LHFQLFSFKEPSFLKPLNALQTNIATPTPPESVLSTSQRAHNTHTSNTRSVVLNLWAEGSQVQSYDFVREPN